MVNDQRALAITATTPYQDNSSSSSSSSVADDGDPVRDIHALTPPPASQLRRRESWDRSSISNASDAGSSENFTTMSREFNALVLAGAEIDSISYSNEIDGENHRASLLERIREDDLPEEEANPLAIVPETNPLGPVPTPTRRSIGGAAEISVQRVKKEEVETKIKAWQNAKIAKINNRLKREEAVISGWESEQVQKSKTWMKKVERKLEEKRAKAKEKMENEVAKAHRKAEERRASAESVRGTKVAKILEIATLMRAVGRPPAKRSFF